MANSPRQQIASIDKQIDATRKELVRRVRARPHSTSDWQAAWDRHPELRAQEIELFRQRGITQRERDMADHQAFMRSKPRVARAKKCPTCGSRSPSIARTSAERVA